MDPQFRNQPSQPIQRNEPNLQVHKPRQKRTPLIIILVIVLLAITGGTTWWLTSSQANSKLSEKDARIAELEQEIQNLQSQTEDTQPDVTNLPNQQSIDEIKTALDEKNYDSLVAKLADRVSVIRAASDGSGVRTQEQAISDLAVLNDATTPWDFELPEDTINTYKAGDYGIYLPDGALIGQAENDMVVAIGFNGSGKINSIFISTNASLLE